MLKRTIVQVLMTCFNKFANCYNQKLLKILEDSDICLFMWLIFHWICKYEWRI